MRLNLRATASATRLPAASGRCAPHACRGRARRPLHRTTRRRRASSRSRDFPWTSHRATLGIEPRPNWLDSRTGSPAFATNRHDGASEHTRTASTGRRRPSLPLGPRRKLPRCSAASWRSSLPRRLHGSRCTPRATRSGRPTAASTAPPAASPGSRGSRPPPTCRAVRRPLRRRHAAGRRGRAARRRRDVRRARPCSPPPRTTDPAAATLRVRVSPSGAIAVERVR